MEEEKDVKMGFGILILLCCELSEVMPGAYSQFKLLMEMFLNYIERQRYWYRQK